MPQLKGKLSGKSTHAARYKEMTYLTGQPGQKYLSPDSRVAKTRKMDELRGLSKTITQESRNEKADLDAIDYDPDEMPKMHLVPCRWQRTGWKYVEADPGSQNFFNNPNRVNSFGISPKSQHKMSH
jgi:hypothetical protein